MSTEKNFTPCKGTNRAGNRCGLRPIPGGTVCKWHGGGAPQVKAAAAQRLATQKIEASATAELAHLGITAVEDPLAELGKLANASTAMMKALGARVNNLKDLEHYGAEYSPVLKAEVALYERAMDRTHRLLDSLVKHGYAERQVSIAESEALLVAGVIRRVVAGLGLTPAQQTQAQELLAEEFRALEQAVPRG